mmetsp:Transcript_3666/g.8695  ORF Transcript_3666/g.8695 Transcript_3666/m.8695 type:complete len:569 (-) Transcript_3666:208-1914(-)
MKCSKAALVLVMVAATEKTATMMTTTKTKTLHPSLIPSRIHIRLRTRQLPSRSPDNEPNQDFGPQYERIWLKRFHSLPSISLTPSSKSSPPWAAASPRSSSPQQSRINTGSRQQPTSYYSRHRHHHRWQYQNSRLRGGVYQAKKLNLTAMISALAAGEEKEQRERGWEWQVTTIADGKKIDHSYEDGPASSAHINGISSLCYGPRTGSLYFTDPHKHTVRKLAPNGIITTHAGTPKTYGPWYVEPFGPKNFGVPNPEQFQLPFFVTADKEENLYVADTYNFRVPKILPDGKVEFFAGPLPDDGAPQCIDGKQFKGRFLTVGAVFADDHDNLYVIDPLSRCVRKVCNDTQRTLVTLRGDIPWDNRKLIAPRGIVVDPEEKVYVSLGFGYWNENKRSVTVEENSHCIMRILPNGEIARYAGAGDPGHMDGPRLIAKFDHPLQLARGPDGYIYIADAGNNAIRTLSPDGIVDTIAGGKDREGKWDGPAEMASFSKPLGVAVDDSGNIFVADYANAAIRKISRTSSEKVSTWEDAIVEPESVTERHPKDDQFKPKIFWNLNDQDNDVHDDNF